MLLGINGEMVVMIPERFKFRPVKSRMGSFVDRFSMAKSSSEIAKNMRKPRIKLGLTAGDFSNDRSMFVKKMKTECYCMLLTDSRESLEAW